MKVYINAINGIDDAIVSMMMSKRTWNKELDRNIRNVCSIVNSSNGYFIPVTNDADERSREAFEMYENYMEKLLKWGTIHPTLLRFIDLSITVEGLHRAGQDDWDAHAMRFQNRIMRSSTAFAKFEQNEISDYYAYKIIPTDVALSSLGLEVPQTIKDENGVKYVKCVNGYVREDLKDNKAVLRGLYMLSIPSNFIFRCNFTDWTHVYKERGKHGGANPEVKELAERIADLLEEWQPKFTRELFMKVNS